LGFLKKLLGRSKQSVVIVSGLPRSGTSMVMRMLEVGGVPVLVDGIRRPNADNPKGYYEFERVKKLPEGDVAWLQDAEGKVVKIIAALLMHLPATHTYQVLFMRRRMEEILASQKQMLVRRQEDVGAVSDEEMAQLFDKHLAQIYGWLARQPNLTYMDVDYNQLLVDPMPVLTAMQGFLNRSLDLAAMAAVVDASLYRQRAEE
jgi:hypothetical protein